MRILSLFALCTAAFAEVHTLTLQQAVDRALSQNPDVVIAQLDEVRARLQIDAANAPRSLQVYTGSGMAYTHGFPVPLDGNPPAIIQFNARRTFFDLPQNYRTAQAKELARASGITTRQRREEVAYRVTAAFLDAEHAALGAKAAADEVTNLDRIRSLVEVNVREGRERSIEARQAEVNVKSARMTIREFESVQTSSEISLAQILSFPPGDRVRPALEERARSLQTVSEEQAIREAQDQSLALRQLQSQIVAKEWEAKSHRAEKWPKINLVASYSMLSKFNNFEDYYRTFSRHNFQIGASIQIPILTGTGPKTAAAQVDVDIQKLQREVEREKRRIAGEVQQSYDDLDLAQDRLDLRQDSLDLIRERVSQELRLFQEGRATTLQLETIRAEEQRAWNSYYEAQRTLEIARLNVRRATGTLLASVQ
jgi:outer membrane protein TolC